MGYTHTWDRWTNNEPADAYGKLLIDTKQIIAAASKRDIKIVGWDNDPATPVELSEGRISFNGGCETFLWEAAPSRSHWLPEEVQPDGSMFSFCKTRELPYDTVVCAVLIRAKKHYGDSIAISSDGSWEEWADGVELVRSAFNEEPAQPWA